LDGRERVPGTPEGGNAQVTDTKFRSLQYVEIPGLPWGGGTGTWGIYYNGVNLKNGYTTIEIRNPRELLRYDE
jgi:hypothetical protein